MMSEPIPTASEDWHWMRMAVDLAKESVEEPDRANPAPKVGVVIVKDGQLQGEGFRGKTGFGEHAEYGLLKLLNEVDLEGASVYTTLEPCSRRNHPKRPCVTHLIDRRVSTVSVGMYDPNPRIYREGWRLLNEAGVRLRDFPPELRSEIRADNRRFLDQFRVASSLTGTAHFDYMQNSGRFDIASDDRGFSTRWTGRGKGSIYALDYENHVALARYATEFTEIDDPSALDFSNYTVGVSEGQIVVFRNPPSYLLIRVERVEAGPDYGDDRTEVEITYEVRRPISDSLSQA